jgi:glutamyl-tRNA synthetase/glutamyl-Q tRNA(Asp) synthetase
VIGRPEIRGRVYLKFLRSGVGSISHFRASPSQNIDGPRLANNLRARLDAPLTRFAPAPTGYLHLGHIVSAIFVWGLARTLGGRVLLRIEDHDRQRSRSHFEAALLDDLDWLGFEPDIFKTGEFRLGDLAGRQSDRDAEYRKALAPLIAQRLVYGCDCSRQQIEGPVYSGRCRERRLPLRDGFGWRLRVGASDERFDDAILGPQHQAPAEQCGDLLIRDRLGNWTYQWAATTDDTLQAIDLVIRGEDLLDSTGRLILVARLLGRSTPPVFAHHPLLMKSATQKLSKSDGDTGVRDLRKAGWQAPRLIGRAAQLAGLDAPEEVAAHRVGDLFGD